MPVATINAEQVEFEAHLDRLAKDRIVTIITMGMILNIAGFSFSKLEQWLNSREKRIVRDAIPLIRTKDGKLGGLDLHKHFV